MSLTTAFAGVAVMGKYFFSQPQSILTMGESVAIIAIRTLACLLSTLGASVLAKLIVCLFLFALRTPAHSSTSSIVAAVPMRSGGQ